MGACGGLFLKVKRVFYFFWGTCGGLFIKGFLKRASGHLFFLHTVRRSCEEATPQHYRSLACARRTSASLSKHLLYCGLIQYFKHRFNFFNRSQQPAAPWYMFQRLRRSEGAPAAKFIKKCT